MFEINMLEGGFLFFLHIAVERAPADDVEKLRSAADSQDRELLPQGMTQEMDLYFVFQRMGFLKVLEIFRPGLVALGFDVLALDQQKALHVRHVFGKASERAFDDRDHNRQNTQLDQKREVK